MITNGKFSAFVDVLHRYNDMLMRFSWVYVIACALSSPAWADKDQLGFLIFSNDFLYFRRFSYIFLRFPINGHGHMFGEDQC